MTFSKLSEDPYAGRTLPEVILASGDPSYVYAGLAAGAFTGSDLAEATFLADRASRIRLPGSKPGDVTLYYRHAGAETSGGFTVVSAKKAPKYAPFAAAQSEGLDLSMAFKVAPKDPKAGPILVAGLKLAVWGRIKVDFTAEACAEFFNDESRFL